MKRPGVAEVVFLLVALSVFRGAQHSLLDDPGVGWHLRNIDAMREQGGWLTTDPFTDPRGGPPAKWYSNQWLGEVPYYLGWKWAGLEGIAIVNALFIAVIAGCVYRYLLTDGLAWPVALAWTALAAMGTSCSWNARPNVVTILFVLVTARVCVRWYEGAARRGGLAGLVALFAVWANTHGGFVLGLVMLVATLGVTLVTQPRRAGVFALVVGGAFLATLVNPYGVGLYRWVFALIGDPYFMTLHQEWKSPDFQSAGAMRYEVLLLLFPLVLALSDRRPQLVELGLAVLFLHLALTGFRYVALWVVVAVPLMGRSSVEIRGLLDLAKRWGITASEGSLFHTPTRRVGWGWTVALGLALVAGVKPLEGRFARHDPAIIPAANLDRFLDVIADWEATHGRPPRLYHDYKWGGYLTWHGWPKVRNWIDDRNEVQGKEHIQDHLRIESAEPGWEERLGNVDLLCIDPDTPLGRRLGKGHPAWHEVDRDRFAVIYERAENPR